MHSCAHALQLIDYYTDTYSPTKTAHIYVMPQMIRYKKDTDTAKYNATYEMAELYARHPNTETAHTHVEKLLHRTLQ